MAGCCDSSITINPDACIGLKSTDIAPLQYIRGLDANGCEKWSLPSSISCSMFALLPTGAPLQIGDKVIGPDCLLHPIVASTFLNLLSGCTTPSATTNFNASSGQICVTVSPTWVKSLFNATGDAYITLTYNPATGATSAVIDPNSVVSAGLCASLGALPTGSPVIYNVTKLVGQDCQVHVVPAQVLSFSNLSRDLSISAGNTVNIPDKYVSNFFFAGNVATIVMNDGQVFTAAVPMTVDINVASFSMAGSTLTITETDGTIHTVTIPDCCPTSLTMNAGILTLTTSGGGNISVPIPDLKITNFVLSGNSFVLSRSDGQVWTVPLPTPSALACLDVVACLTEGRNIDIQPTGQINAGYLRNDGADSYTWVNQDGADIYTFAIPASNATCVAIQNMPVGLTAGPGQSIYLVGQDCNIHEVVIPAASAPFNLCLSIGGLPLGTTMTPGSTALFVDPATCTRRQFTLPVPFDLCAGLGALATGATLASGGTLWVVDPNLCQSRLVTIPAPYDLCAGLGALPSGSTAVAGQSITVVDPTSCTNRIINIPQESTVSTSVSGPGGGAVSLTTGGVAGHAIDLALDLAGLSAAASCTTPATVVGGDNLRYSYPQIAAKAQFTPRTPTAPPASGTTVVAHSVVMESGTVSLTNNHACKNAIVMRSIVVRVVCSMPPHTRAEFITSTDLDGTGYGAADGHLTLLNAETTTQTMSGLVKSDVHPAGGVLGPGATRSRKTRLITANVSAGVTFSDLISNVPIVTPALPTTASGTNIEISMWSHTE
jgi:hypothetical protein